MLNLIFLIIQLSIAVFAFFLTIAFITGAPFVPSANRTAQRMVDIASIKKGERVYDLGSGNGKLLFLAAQKGAIAVGYEINPYLVLYTNIRAFLSLYRSTVFVYWKNFWKADIHTADVVFIYLLPWRMNELQTKFLGTLNKGTRIVTNSFLFPQLTPESEDREHHVYLYIVK